MSTGERADVEQREKALAASVRGRSDLEPIGDTVAETIAAVGSAFAAYRRKKQIVLAGDCPPCRMDSRIMRECQFAGDDDCRHSRLMAERSAEKSRFARMKRGGVPEEFWETIAKNLIETCAAKCAVARLLAGETRIAVLLGTPGSGKSLLGGHAVAERGGMFTPASSFDWWKDTDERSGFLEQLYSEPLVVLDDVGRGRSAEAKALQRTEDLICIRYDRKLPTVVTANLLPEAFWSAFGGPDGRVASRLGTGNEVLCVEPDRRKYERHDPTPFNERAEN